MAAAIESVTIQSAVLHSQSDGPTARGEAISGSAGEGRSQALTPRPADRDTMNVVDVAPREGTTASHALPSSNTVSTARLFGDTIVVGSTTEESAGAGAYATTLVGARTTHVRGPDTLSQNPHTAAAPRAPKVQPSPTQRDSVEKNGAPPTQNIRDLADPATPSAAASGQHVGHRPRLQQVLPHPQQQSPRPHLMPTRPRLQMPEDQPAHVTTSPRKRNRRPDSASYQYASPPRDMHRSASNHSPVRVQTTSHVGKDTSETATRRRGSVEEHTAEEHTADTTALPRRPEPHYMQFSGNAHQRSPQQPVVAATARVNGEAESTTTHGNQTAASEEPPAGTNLEEQLASCGEQLR